MSGHDWLEEEEVSLHALCVQQAKILTGVANALRGDPPDLHHWSHHDLAERARDVVAENKRLREIIDALVEYAEELLVDHLVRLGETTTKNRHIAESLREDIAAARAALRGDEVRDA